MDVSTLLIAWHPGRFPEPVMTADFHRTGILATGGADATVKIWHVLFGENHKPHVSFRSSLLKHNKPVNCVRFSPSQDQIVLASSGDDGMIYLWSPTDIDPAPDSENSEVWQVRKMLRLHPADVYDLSWSWDGEFLLSGSVDNSSILWEVWHDNPKVEQFREHSHYVQGVSIDPLSAYFGTQSSDRSVKVYSITQKKSAKQSFYVKHSIKRREQTEAEDDNKAPLEAFNLFRDESISTFFRRLDWSPDGSFLVVPAGQFREDEDDRLVNCAYIFHRSDLSRPCAVLPLPKQKVSVAVRFSPVLYHKRKTCSESALDSELQYRMIFALATLDCVLLYDTSSLIPFAYVSDIHYATLTDLSWSPAGNSLIVSSLDGYCTFISFDIQDIGDHLSPEETDGIMSELREAVQYPLRSRSRRKSSSSDTKSNESSLESSITTTTSSSTSCLVDQESSIENEESQVIHSTDEEMILNTVPSSHPETSSLVADPERKKRKIVPKIIASME